MTFTYPVQVRWSDYDASGHVNNAVFLSYLEQARMMLLAELLGTDVWRYLPHLVRSQSIEYTQALTLVESPVDVVVSRRRVGTTSYTLDYRVVSAAGQHAFSTCSVVTVDPTSGRPAPLPAALRQGLEALAELDLDGGPCLDRGA
jgi:acyl-CoA thioester hydrolase